VRGQHSFLQKKTNGKRIPCPASPPCLGARPPAPLQMDPAKDSPDKNSQDRRDRRIPSAHRVLRERGEKTRSCAREERKIRNGRIDPQKQLRNNSEAKGGFLCTFLTRHPRRTPVPVVPWTGRQGRLAQARKTRNVASAALSPAALPHPHVWGQDPRPLSRWKNAIWRGE
jgi:hypothetical protein